MRSRLLSLTGLFLAATAMLTSPAAAQKDDCLDGCNGGNGNVGDGSIGAHTWETKPGVGGTQTVSNVPAWLQACSWLLLQPGQDVPPGLADGALFGGVEEPTWIVTCPDESLRAVGFGDFATGVLEIFADGEVPPRLIDAVIAEARNQTPLVAFFPSSAPLGSVDIPMITRLPTWLWIDEADWHPVSATATVPPLSITVTAVPVSTTWTGGDDPESITCDQGIAFDFEEEFDRQETDCKIEFWHTDNVEPHELTVSVTWEVSYVCSAVCGAGTLADAVTESTRSARVAEIQALVTHIGSTKDG